MGFGSPFLFLQPHPTVLGKHRFKACRIAHMAGHDLWVQASYGRARAGNRGSRVFRRGVPNEYDSGGIADHCG